MDATLDHAGAALGAGLAVERGEVVKVASNVLVRPRARAGGRAVTLWPWLDLAGEAGDAAEAGRALRACHDALGALEPADLDLAPLAMLTEARQLAAAALPEVLPAVERALATLGAAP